MRNPTQKQAVRGLKPAKLHPNARARLRMAVLETLEDRRLFAANWIDTTNPAAVVQAYQQDQAVTRNVPIGWTGEIFFDGNVADGYENITVTGGIAGTTSQAFRDAQLHRANYFRRMAGMVDIAFDPTLNQFAQEYALFGSAYRNAPIFPNNANKPLATPGAKLAGQFASLAGGGVLGADAMTGLWIDGPSLEHRNQFLNSRATIWGVGNVPENNGSAAAAIDPDDGPLFAGQAIIYCPPPAQNAPAQPTREPFVAWPPPEYTPIQVLQSFFGENDNSNWNFNYPFADFTDAKVTVTRDDDGVGGNAPQPVRVDFIGDLSGQERSTISGRQDAELQWRLRVDTLRVGSTYHVHVSNFFLPGDPNPHEQEYDVKPIDGENPAALHVTQPVYQSRSPIVTLVPTSQAVRTGNIATFTAEATGAAGVQWQVSTDDGNTWSDLAGETSTTLNVFTTAADNDNRYQAVFTSNVTTFGASAATGELDVQWQVSTNGGATYSNVPAGWLVNNRTSLGSYYAPYETTSYLSVPQGELNAGDRFKAIFTNDAGIQTTTAPYTAYIDSPLPAVTPVPVPPAEPYELKGKLTVSDAVEPADQSVLVGDRATFTASVSGNTPTGVEWEVSTDGGLSYTAVAGSLKLASATVPISPSSTLVVPQVFAGMSGNRYRAIFTFGVNGIDGRQTSQPASLTVSPKQPADIFIDAGGRGAGNYVADFGFSGTSTAQSNLMYGRAVIKTGVANPAPETVYRSIRSGPDFTYTIGGLAPGQPHTVTLDFAALFMEQAGSRLFDVYANQALALANVGPVGGAFKFEPVATQPSFQTVADVNGVIRLRFLATIEEAMVNGIRITQGGALPTTPTITQNPTTRVVQAGSTTVFTATAIGSPAPTVKWQRSTDGGLSYADLPGQTGTTLTLTNVAANQNGQQYRAVFTNAQNTAISTVALLGVRSGPAVDSLYIDAGGSGGGSYVSEANYFVSGGIRTTPTVIDTSGVPNPAPQTVNQSLRIGNLGVPGAANFQPFGYVVPNLVPGATYTVNLDFAEQNFSTTGSRVFDVSINDAPKLTQFDPVAAAGQHKLVRRSFDVAADANGIITIRVSAGGIINAISFLKTEQVEVPYELRIAAGSDAAIGGFAADTNFSGGEPYFVSGAVDTSQIFGAPAPQEVYQHQRYSNSNFSYTIPDLTPGKDYGVTLHFAEVYYNGPGGTTFDVTMNGVQRLNDFDIYAEAGGQFKAINSIFVVTANPFGKIVIDFVGVGGKEAQVSGIEVFSPAPPPIVGGPGGPPPVGGGGFEGTPVVFQTVFRPSADAYVQDGTTSNTNFGTSPQLLSKKSDSAGFNRNSLIKFDLTTFADSADDVILRVYGKLQDSRGANIPTDVFTTTTGWTETGVKWSNKPAAGTYQGTVVVAGAAGDFYDVNVTDFVQAELAAGRKNVAFLLKNPATALPYSGFDSREALNKPLLIVTTGSDGADAPAVSAGPDKTGTVGAAVALDGTASTPPTTTRVITLTNTWSLISGPGTVAFADATQAATTATFAKEGTYVLRLTSTDGQFTEADDVTITVKKPVTFTATADAYVEDGASAGRNFAKATKLLVKKSPNAGFTREALLKFNLSSFTSTASSVVLRVFGSLQDTRATNVATDVYSTSTSWTETGVKWSNRPSSTSGPLGTIVVVNTTGKYYDLDVTAYVKAELAAGRKTVAFLLRNPTNADPYSAFASRESANKPQLLVG